MPTDSSDLRFRYVEKDVEKLQDNDRMQDKSIVNIEKGNVKQEIFVVDIFKKITVLETLVNNSITVSTRTETLAKDLKKDADEQKDNTKWSTRFWKSAAYTNGIVFLIWIVKQLISWTNK